MNILFLCDEYPPCSHGGIGSVTRVLSRELAIKGHKIVVCGFYPYYRTALREEDDKGVKVFRYFYGTKIKLKLSRHMFFGRFVNVKNEFSKYLEFLKKIIVEYKIEIAEMPDYSEIFRYTGPRFIQFPYFGIPKVVKIHGGDTFFHYIKEGNFERNIHFLKEEKVLSDATIVLAISDYSKSVIKKVFDYKNDIPVIYNGIENSKDFKYVRNENNKFVVFAGTITEKKGVFSLVRAWERVVSEIPEVTLLIYGKGSTKTIRELKNLVSEKTRYSIQLKGFADLDTIQQAYSNACCAVFPSYAESFGMAPIEAMQTGCPTIFTTRASGPELIQQWVEGILVDPDNIEEISQAIIYLLKNPEKANEIGFRGALKVKTNFNISQIADQHISLYKTAVNTQ